METLQIFFPSLSLFLSLKGGVAASWLALAASRGGAPSLPPAVYGVLAVACGIAALALPETKGESKTHVYYQYFKMNLFSIFPGRRMPDTIAQSEQMRLRPLREVFCFPAKKQPADR